MAWEVLNDPTGAAADIQNTATLRASRLHVPQDDAVPGSLPIPLERNWTVEGAVVIVHGGHGISETPHAEQGLQEGPSEGEETGMGASGAPSRVMKGHLPNPPALSMHADQDLFQHIKIACREGQVVQDAPSINPEAAG